MMLQGPKAASALARAATSSTKTLLVARRRPAAFKSAARTTRVSVRAAAEEEPEQAAAPEPAVVDAASAPRNRRPVREVTVDVDQVEVGSTFVGTVTSVESYGAFVNIGASKDGLVHISQLKDGYVGSASDVVSVGDEVNVRVLSLEGGKISLTMKGGAGAGGEEGADFGGEGDALDLALEEAEAAEELVYADEASDFSFPFVVEEEEAEEGDAGEGELSAKALAALGEEDLDIEHLTDLELPINELVTGTITSVDAYGAYVLVSHNGTEVEAYLDKEEAKVPSSALSAEDLLEFVGEGEPVPEYIDILGEDILYEDDEDEDLKEEVDDRFMFEDLSVYYKVGDKVSAFVLGFDLRKDMMALTQFTDVEVQAGGLSVVQDALLDEEDEDEDEGEGGFRRDKGRGKDRDGFKPRFGAGRGDDDDEEDENEVPLSRLGLETDFDPLAFSPAELLEMVAEEDGGADGDAADDDMDGEAADAIGEYKVVSRGLLGLSSSNRSIRASDVTFPERPTDSVDPFALQSVKRTDTDFDGDEIYLDDIWQDTGFEVSAAAWKKLGLKMQFDEGGEAEVVEREAAAAGEGEEVEELAALDLDDLMVAASGNHDARVAEWVALLTEADEDEAELPAFAARKPLRS